METSAFGGALGIAYRRRDWRRRGALDLSVLSAIHELRGVVSFDDPGVPCGIGLIRLEVGWP